MLVTAFNAVEDARGEVPLTYFEYGTLAALWLLARAPLDVAILEVGLGGRLDAVNVIDADIAVVTSVDLDHMDYLGPTREDIGREKAGIFRRGRPVVCAEADPPSSLVAIARALDAPFLLIGRDYGFAAGDGQWEYWGPGGRRHALPFPRYAGPTSWRMPPRRSPSSISCARGCPCRPARSARDCSPSSLPAGSRSCRVGR